MKRKRFTEEQIIGLLKEHEAVDLCRKHGVSDASIYKWKAKFGGMDVSEARRLRSLEDENAKLKRLLADAMNARPSYSSKLGRFLCELVVENEAYHLEVIEPGCAAIATMRFSALTGSASEYSITPNASITNRGR